MIVGQFGYGWQNEFIEPLSTPAIIRRMVNNVFNCCQRSFRRDLNDTNNINNNYYNDNNEIRLQRIQIIDEWSRSSSIQNFRNPHITPDMILGQLIQAFRPVFNPYLFRRSISSSSSSNTNEPPPTTTTTANLNNNL